MFALVRDLAAGRNVGEIAAHPDVVRRHLLAPLAASAGARAFHDDLVRATVAWARIEHELPSVVTALARAGVPVAPIKGVAYATSVYQTPAERPMTDVDLLVPLNRARVAEGVLAAQGFSCDSALPFHHASTWVREWLVIDLHHGILGPGRSRMDLEHVWTRATPGWPHDGLRLDPVDELVFHLVHMARNRLCGPLIQIVDASRLFARCDRERALVRARDWGLAPAVKLAMRYCIDVLAGTSEPGGWLGPRSHDVLAVQQPSTLRKIMFDIATAGSASQLAARIRAYAMSRSLS